MPSKSAAIPSTTSNHIPISSATASAVCLSAFSPKIRAHQPTSNVAVASNKYQSAVDKLIYHYFGGIRWSDVEGQRDEVPVKPDPSIVFSILSKVPTPKDDVLYVGDSGVDMETARRACVESVGVTWGFRPESELRKYGADHIIHRPVELLSLLESSKFFSQEPVNDI